MFVVPVEFKVHLEHAPGLTSKNKANPFARTDEVN
jgi:hypothetical protein